MSEKYQSISLFLEGDKYKVHILNDFPINGQHQTIFILIYFDVINESLIIKQDVLLYRYIKKYSYLISINKVFTIRTKIIGKNSVQ